MFHFLSKMVEEVKKGENIDHYLTILLAICLALGNIFGLISEDLLLPLTLTTLGVFAFSSLGNRHRIDDIVKYLNKRHIFFDRKFPPAFEADIERASELWLVGIGTILDHTIRTNYTLLENKLNQRNKIRVLLTHPDGPVLEIVTTRNYGSRNIEDERSAILKTLKQLSELKERTNGDIHIRTIKYPLSYGVSMITPTETLEYYTLNTIHLEFLASLYQN